jgi:hypothetical protein
MGVPVITMVSSSRHQNLTVVSPAGVAPTGVDGKVETVCTVVDIGVAIGDVLRHLVPLVDKMFDLECVDVCHVTQNANPWLYSSFIQAHDFVKTLGPNENSLCYLLGERQNRPENEGLARIANVACTKIVRTIVCMIGFLYLLDLNKPMYVRAIAEIVHQFVFKLRYWSNGTMAHDLEFVMLVFVNWVLATFHQHVEPELALLESSEFDLRGENTIRRGMIRDSLRKATVYSGR